MSEATDQMALFDFLKRMEGRYPVLEYVRHCPNGEKRDKATAARLKRMGVRAGVWDVEFLQPNLAPIEGYTIGYFRGVAIELKHGGNTLTIPQQRWEVHYRTNRWFCAIAYEWTFAAHLLVRWVGGDPEEVLGL